MQKSRSAFYQDLQRLEKHLLQFLRAAKHLQKSGSTAVLKEYKSQLQLCQKIRPVLQKNIQEVKEKLPPTSVLDGLYEEVIEWNKKVETKASLEHRAAYEKALTAFLKAYQKEAKNTQALWLAGAEECTREQEVNHANLARAEQVKAKVDNLEAEEQAKVYYIIKGKDKNGKVWGRIDYVGQAYVMVHQNSKTGANNLPLQIHYFTYAAGTYHLEGKSSVLKTSFDKQLMHAFQKSGCTSYEAHKNLGRDYEYHPSNAPITGKGKWYLRMEALPKQKRVAKVIEVPDWEDFGFTDLYQRYLKECEAGDLLPEGQKELKAEMRQQIAQQKERLQELETFHVRENDQDKNTANLIVIWKKRIGAFEAAMQGLKVDCFTPPVPPVLETPAPPITSPVPRMPPINFIPDGFTRLSGYYEAAKDVAQWLIDNPDYNIKIISDALPDPNPDIKSWDDNIPKSKKKLTYKTRLSELLTSYREDIIAKSKGKVDKTRIITCYGRLTNDKVSTISIPR